MMRYIIVGIVAIILIGVGIFSIFHRAPSTGSPANPATNVSPSVTVSTGNQQQVKSPTQQAVTSSYQAEIAPNNIDNIKTYDTAVSGNYALQLWRGTNTGGEALLKFDGNTAHWIVISKGGGAWSVGTLVDQGVPTSTAQALLANMPH